jgi:hypothetical protein
LDTATNTCYQDIPLAEGARFVKPVTRIFTSHSAPQPCNDHYGLKLLTEENVWIKMNPGAKQKIAPKAMPIETHDFQHEDLTVKGLYTRAELNSWKKHLELGDYHDAVTKTISHGICAKCGDCRQSFNVPRYNLKYLPADEMITRATWSFAKKLDEFIQTTGCYLAAAAIMIEELKLFNFLAAIVVTVVRDGIEGVKASSVVTLTPWPARWHVATTAVFTSNARGRFRKTTQRMLL